MGAYNLAELGERAHERLGGAGVIWFEGQRLTGDVLTERTRRLGAGFRELGIAPGDRVVVFMANRPDVGVTYTALWRAGAVITPAIFLLPAADLRHILEDSEAVAIVTTPEFAGVARAAAEGVESIRWVIVAEQPPEGTVSLDELASEEPGEIVPRDDDDLAAVMYTGGTTGRAKGVMLSHANMYRTAESTHRATYRQGLTKTLVPLPLSHSYGLMVSVIGQFAEEPGEAVLLRWFEPQLFLQSIQDHGLHRATAVPSMLQLLLDQPLEDYDLSTLRYVNSGASPLAPEVAHAFEQRVPNVLILEGYGLTENAAVMTVTPPEDRRLGSVGLPIPGNEVAIVDPEGNPVPTGEPGEICLRGPGVMLGYWRSPEATATALQDGWLHTGDVGRVDQDGYVYVVDRLKDLIIRGGFNVFPRDVEDVLLEHPAVLMAGVIGVPDPVKGEEVVAYASLHPGHEVTPEELVAFGKERLGRYKYPREVRIVPAIPVTPVGKIDRKRLRGMARGEE